ncbi:MAG: hypothetical protein ACMG51_04685 [Ginsengibacter sp.]
MFNIVHHSDYVADVSISSKNIQEKILSVFRLCYYGYLLAAPYFEL